MDKPSDNARSPHWPHVRAVWLHTNPTCAACGGTEHVEVHHKKPFHLHPELELDPKNFVTLCEHPSRLCHLVHGHARNWHAFNPDVDADAARYLAILAEARKRAAA